ncbi:sensor histidine kinase [Bifidobacterium samirii]|nr:histidine kinase [Bifidobacterium samirii]
MIPSAMFMCLAQISFRAQPYLERDDGDPFYAWLLLGTFLAFVWPFLLLRRDRHPESTFWITLAVTLAFPYDPTLMLMALTALIARRRGASRTMPAIVAALATSLWAQLRDALQPAESSLWHEIFSDPAVPDDLPGVPMRMLASERTIVVTALLTALFGMAVAVVSGLVIRSHAHVRQSVAKAEAATRRAESLRHDLDSQQLADAIAAEAHDTLAHSLSLIALNASALQAEADRLSGPSGADAGGEEDRRRAEAVALKADEIRRQSAGALDEAHAIIDMLRHPQRAWEQLAAGDDETSLTRESLGALVEDARQAGMALDTWIDIRQLGELDERIGKAAYRTVQEALTNARRHAPGAPVSLEVDAGPESGVHIHASNPTSVSSSTPAGLDATTVSAAPGGPTGPADTRIGAGLPGLAARVGQIGGECRYGTDRRHVFHLDVTLPWTATDGSGVSAPAASYGAYESPAPSGRDAPGYRSYEVPPSARYAPLQWDA